MNRNYTHKDIKEEIKSTNENNKNFKDLLVRGLPPNDKNESDEYCLGHINKISEESESEKEKEFNISIEDGRIKMSELNFESKEIKQKKNQSIKKRPKFDNDDIIKETNIRHNFTRGMTIQPNSSNINREKSNILNEKKNDNQPITRRNKRHCTVQTTSFVQKFLFSNYITQVGCSSIYFGLTPIKQESFECLECLVNDKLVKICKYCYENCHFSCRATMENTQLDSVTSTFYCYCGIYMKHYPQPKKEQKLVPCAMMELDQFLGVTEFYCNSEQQNICCACSVSCHKECSIRHKTHFSSNELKQCQCTNKAHSSKFNEMAFNFPIDEFRKASEIYIWPIQIINIFFKTEKIFAEAKNKLKDNLNQDSFAILHNPDILSIIEIFANTLNKNIKTYYYNKEIMESLRYERLFLIIKEITLYINSNNKKTNAKLILANFRLLFFLLFIHLKRDYQILKTLTSIDFLSNSIIDRLMYKQTLKTKSQFNGHLFDKYDISDGFPFKEFVIDSICSLIVNGVDLVSITENPNEYEIIIKLLCFMIKHYMFDKEDLIKLISSLYHFHYKLFNLVTSNKNNIYPLLDIFNGLIELSFMIGVSYNDTIIEAFINENKPLNNFIHKESEHGRMLLMLIIKNCNLIERHYAFLKMKDSNEKLNQIRDKLNTFHRIAMHKRMLHKTTKANSKITKNGGLLTEKIVMLLDESLQLFCLADNNYQKQIEDITQDDLNYYHDYKNAISRSDFFYLVTMAGQKNDSNILHHLKISIETLLLEIFAIAPLEKENTLSQEISKRLLNAIDLITINFSSIKMKPKELNDMDISPYSEKIIKQLSKVIPFVKQDSFKLKLTNFIQILVYSQIDELLLKLLVFFSKRMYPNLLNKETVKLIFSFLSLFCLTRQGFKYLLTGKTISRLNKMLGRYSYKPNNKNINVALGRIKEKNNQYFYASLEFLYLIAKGLNYYQLNIQKHKILFNLRKTLIVHLEVFNQETNLNIIYSEYKRQLFLIIKIFVLISNSFNYEIYQEIKESMINILINSHYSLFTSEKFLQLFSSEKVNSLEHSQNNIIEIPVNPINLFTNQTEQNESKHLITKTINNNTNENDEGSVLRKNNNNITTAQNTPEPNQIKDKSLFFYFFKLITKDTFYVYKNNPKTMELINIFDKFNKLDEYKELLNSNKFTLSQRIILFKFLKTYYFIDYLDPYDIKKQSFCLTNKEMKKLIVMKLVPGEKAFDENYNYSMKKYQKLTQIEINDHGQKYDQINRLIIIIELYIHEWEIFPTQLEGCKPEDVNEFLLELLNGTKLIGEHLIQNIQISNKIIPIFYKLTLEFLYKNTSILSLHEMIKTNQSLLDLSMIKLHDNTPIITLMKTKKFDIFNKTEIFKHLLESLNFIYTQTNINKETKLATFLESYDKMAEANFTPFALLKTKDYEYFYEFENQEERPSQNKFDKLKETIMERYIEEFSSITKTNFLSIVSSQSSEMVRFDYQKQIIDYFNNFINSTQGTNMSKFQGILCIVTKYLLYDTSNIQEKMLHLKKDENFFSNINRILNNYIVLVISSSKKPELFELSLTFTNLAKLIMQFLQLIGEDFNIAYHYNVFNLQSNNDEDKLDDWSETSTSEPENEVTLALHEKIIGVIAKNSFALGRSNEDISQRLPITLSLYETIIQNAVRCYDLMSLPSMIEAEFPFDKLCILTTNFIDFLIEYIESFGSNENTINQNMEYLFFDKYKGVLPLLKFKLDVKKYPQRNNLICYLKIKYCQLLISYLQTGNKETFAFNLVTKGYSSIELFSEILFYFNKLFDGQLSIFDKNKKNKTDWLYIYYVFNPDFREAIEITVCFKLYILIRIYEEFYNDRVLRTNFESEPKESFVDPDYLSINSNFAYQIYNFLEIMITKVEVKTKTVNSNSVNTFASCQKIADQLSSAREGKKYVNRSNEKSAISLTKSTFFVKPYLTFFISNQSKRNFIIDVNRLNASTKFVDLTLYTDIFAFEMINNMHIVNYSLFRNFLANIKFYYLEFFSFIMVFIQNILIIYHYFISPEWPPSIYDVRDEDIISNKFIGNFIVCIIQIVFVFGILYLWFRFKFIISLQRNIMLKESQNFIFYKRGQIKDNIRQQDIVNYFQCNESASLFKILKIINRNVSTLKLFYLIVFDTILFNREVCFFVYTLVFNTCYLIFGNEINMAIPSLFISNLSPTLADIVKTIKMKIFNIFIVLLFMFMICYIYSWFTMYFMKELYDFPDILQVQSKAKIHESFCSSSIQCLLFIIQQGIRAGGGIGDITPRVSFQTNTKFFFLNFFYDMMYHILVVWILGNVFTGLIVDTFAELRDINSKNENDKENICFICQITRDDCIQKNLDFDKHREKEHNIWVYMDFLMHLHLSNSNDFSRVENIVWEKLKEQDYGWLPIRTQNNDD